MTITVATLAERALRHLGVAVVPAANRPALAATNTAAAIATAALIELAVIAADETPATLDQALAVAKVNAIHDGLVGQGFVSWEGNAIPQAVSEEYVKLTALAVGPAFGEQAGTSYGQSAGVDQTVVAALEARIKRFAIVLRAPAIAQAAVMAVHNDQAMRGRTRWTTQDIPDSLAQPYMMLAAANCAPEFGGKPDTLEMQLAERMISRYIALPSSGSRVQATYF